MPPNARIQHPIPAVRADLYSDEVRRSYLANQLVDGEIHIGKKGEWHLILVLEHLVSNSEFPAPIPIILIRLRRLACLETRS